MWGKKARILSSTARYLKVNHHVDSYNLPRATTSPHRTKTVRLETRHCQQRPYQNVLSYGNWEQLTSSLRIWEVRLSKGVSEYCTFIGLAV